MCNFAVTLCLVAVAAGQSLAISSGFVVVAGTSYTIESGCSTASSAVSAYGICLESAASALDALESSLDTAATTMTVHNPATTSTSDPLACPYASSLYNCASSWCPARATDVASALEHTCPTFAVPAGLSGAAASMGVAGAVMGGLVVVVGGLAVVL